MQGLNYTSGTDAQGMANTQSRHPRSAMIAALSPSMRSYQLAASK